VPQFEVCHTFMPTAGRPGFAPNFTFYVSAIMPRGPISDSDITPAFAKFLEKKHHVACEAIDDRSQRQVGSAHRHELEVSVAELTRARAPARQPHVRGVECCET